MINSKMPLSLVLKDQRVINNVHAKEEIELALFHIVKQVYKQYNYVTFPVPKLL